MSQCFNNTASAMDEETKMTRGKGEEEAECGIKDMNPSNFRNFLSLPHCPFRNRFDLLLCHRSDTTNSALQTRLHQAVTVMLLPLLILGRLMRMIVVAKLSMAPSYIYI
jgi:hypothetical protein